MPRALARPVRRLVESVRGSTAPARNSRLANGVYEGVAGVVETCAIARALAARFDGDVRKLGVASGVVEAS